MNKTIDIVLPCYNPEEKTWHVDIKENIMVLESLFPELTFYVTLVNDGSTRNVLMENIIYLKEQLLDFQYINYLENQGKGYALREGIKLATHDFVVYTDVDFPFELSCMQAMIDKLLLGKDIVLGERQFSYSNHLRRYRKILSSGSHVFNTLFLNLPFPDTQGGLKGFNQKGRAVFLKTIINRYLFDTEFILRACKQNDLIISTVPLTLREGVILSQMGLKVIKKEFGNIMRLLKIRFFE
jgi:glycosyltransferase involved in cell wall biosynthesis